MIPFVGGIAGYIAVRILFALRYGPKASASWYAFLPALLDPGCYVVAILLVPIARLLSGRGLKCLLALLACAGWAYLKSPVVRTEDSHFPMPARLPPALSGCLSP